MNEWIRVQKVISTPRLDLHHICAEDLVTLFEDPALNRWFVRWIVLRSTGEIIGSTSFHGAPNSDGMIEIGLGIQEGFRNLGYAKESLLGMWRWAMGEPQVEVLR
jgi:ribosomal-protein-alanine N-acetyltransferase